MSLKNLTHSKLLSLCLIGCLFPGMLTGCDDIAAGTDEWMTRGRTQLGKAKTAVTAPVKALANKFITQIGSLEKTLVSEDRFYTIRGHFVYDRFPLRYPLSLVRFNNSASVALLDGMSVELNHVAAIGYQSGFFAGIDVALQDHARKKDASASGRQSQWFLLTPKNEMLLFDTEDAFLAASKSYHLKPFALYLPATLVDSFGESGSCAPLFDIGELKETALLAKDAPDGAEAAQKPQAPAAQTASVSGSGTQQAPDEIVWEANDSDILRLPVTELRKKATAGEVLAQYFLGFRHANGLDVRQSYALAAAWYRKAAEQGYGAAQYDLGHLYERGLGVAASDEQAIAWYCKAAASGDADGQRELAFYHTFEKLGLKGEAAEKQRAYEYRRAAIQGDAQAQYDFAVRCRLGQGTPKSLAEAVYWLRKAARQGHRYAQSVLAGLHLYGEKGVEQSYAEAAHWYRTVAGATPARLIEAQSALGDLYREGNGVKQSYKTSAAWYLEAASTNADMLSSYAQYYLGLYYEKGLGVAQSDKQAAYWYLKSAEQNYWEAQTKIGGMYERGQGVEQSYEKALKYYSKAAPTDFRAVKGMLRMKKKLGIPREK